MVFLFVCLFLEAPNKAIKTSVEALLVSAVTSHGFDTDVEQMLKTHTEEVRESEA